MLKFKVSNQTLTRTDSFVPVADSKNYLTAEFEFSDEWTGGIVAVFTRDGKPQQALLTDGKCTVPWEVIKAPGFYVSAFCGDLITADDVYIKVKAAGITDNDGAVVPTPSVWDDYIKQLAEENSELLDEKLGGAVEEAKTYADSAADTAEGNAKEYADSKAQAAESAAKQYADGKTDAALTAAKSYADTKVAATLAAAEEYSEAKATEAEENAKEYADSIKPTKVSELENDSGYLNEHQSLAGYATEKYADNAAAGAKTASKQYTDTKTAAALDGAKSYTDEKIASSEIGKLADGAVTTAKIADGAVSKAKLAGALKSEIEGKADRYAINTSVTGNTLLLADKSDTQLLSAAAAALTLTLPETVTSGYECFFSFKSGATATTLTVPSGITWTGADCNSGKEFVPLANTVYEVGIRCIGFSSDGTPYLSARVGAC